MAVKVTNAQARKAEYDRARSTPITRIHGRPSRADYDRMIRELSDYAITVNLPAYTWSTDAATGNSYGALPLVIGANAYLNKTGLVFTMPGQPPAFSTRINGNTGELNKAKYTAEHEEIKENFAVLKGAEQGMCDNIRDALDLTYYEQLHDETLGYSQVTVREFLDHLSNKW